jgi:DNA-binding MarR family transcriptional regulator
MRTAAPRDAGPAAKTPTGDLVAFEVATRDLVGVALRSLEILDDDVSLPQFRLLLALYERGRSASTQIAQAMGLVGSSVTRLADRLDASGYLARGSDPSSRSIVTLELTGRGRKLVEQVNTRRRRELRRALDKLDPQQRSTCAEGLRSLHRLLGEDYTANLRGPLPL